MALTEAFCQSAAQEQVLLGSSGRHQNALTEHTWQMVGKVAPLQMIQQQG